MGDFYLQWEGKKKVRVILHHVQLIVKCYLCKNYVGLCWNVEYVVQFDQGCQKSFKESGDK